MRKIVYQLTEDDVLPALRERGVPLDTFSEAQTVAVCELARKVIAQSDGWAEMFTVAMDETAYQLADLVINHKEPWADLFGSVVRDALTAEFGRGAA